MDHWWAIRNQVYEKTAQFPRKTKSLSRESTFHNEQTKWRGWNQINKWTIKPIHFLLVSKRKALWLGTQDSLGIFLSWSRKLNDFHEILLHHPCLNCGASQHCSLELTAILPRTIADHGDPYWALWGVLSLPILSTLPSMPTMPLSQAQPPPRGFQRAKLGPCCNLWDCQPDEVQSCDLPLSWGDFPGWEVRCDGLVPSPPVPFQEKVPDPHLYAGVCM